jgi:hypothetical protein
MKRLLIITLITLSVGTLYSQTDITPKAAEALKKGDAVSLSALMMPQIELTLAGQDGTYSADEAKSLISKFFISHPAKDFTIKHQGTSKLDDQYRIGDLTTAKGNFRVTFFMKKSSGSMLIKQLKIESPSDDF